MRWPAVLLILDGFGIAPKGPTNAISNAQMPHIRDWQKRSSSQLEASGEVVGLPPGQMGSSEVNHLNLGAGRIVPQDILRINNSIDDKSFFKNPVLLDAIKNSNGTIHLLGLVSDGGVHSHLSHLQALITLCKQHGVRPVVHAILDGRDTAPKAAKKFLEEVDAQEATIATIMGRYYAMDRDNRWQRTQQAYETLISNKKTHESWQEALADAYANDESDEFVTPRRTSKDAITDNDTVIFFNFRTDRTRQLTQAFINDGFDSFKQTIHPRTTFIQMTEYDATFDIPTVFGPLELKNTLGEWLSAHDATQLHIAETEKYAHVTFFFNGGREDPFQGEDRTIIKSPDVATYDLAPRMSIDKITDTIIDDIRTQRHHAYIVNFANSDMVGHTGDYEATIKALEAIDESIGRLVPEVLGHDGFMIITADHGNAEEMTGEQQKTHTTNKVPFIIVDHREHALRDGAIPDVAPTYLRLMRLPIPKEMTGTVLFEEHPYKHLSSENDHDQPGE